MQKIFGLLSLTACCAIVNAHAVKFDPPDLTLEQELHRQYLRAHGVAEVPALTPDAYIENYRIQSGETLWSLSQTFYGDGHFWPKVWAQNQSITNPHLIRPGHNLQFMLGSEDETPSFRVSEDDEPGLELVASTSANPLIEIPPPEIPPKTLIKVPKSFPEWQTVYKQLPVQITDEKGLLRQRHPLVGKTYLTAFVQEEPLKSIGKFMEADIESALPTVNQYVYIKMNKGSGAPGQRMLVVRDMGRIRRLNRQTELDVRAYMIQIAGEIELSEKVESDDDPEEWDVYRALITKAFGLAGELSQTVGIIAGAAEVVNLSFNGTPGSARAQIIGSNKAVSSALYAAGEIVFLNKGSAAGLAPDQILDVYADRTIRKPNTTVRVSPAPSGTVRVVRVTENLATAVLLSARDGILPGDRVQQISSRKGDREVLEFNEDKLGHGATEDSIEKEIDSDLIDDSGGASDGAVEEPGFEDEF